MNKVSLYFNKLWKADLLLFLLSFCIYFFYFPEVFLNPNSVLSSITGDSIKNYYTFVYHIKNDHDFLHFAGMNFPYGEHVIFTDCHPGLTFIFQYLPFTHNYLIGIMHVLIFLSYLIAPCITNRIFIRLGLDLFSGLFISVGLTLLAPQFMRIYEGHFSMAYAVIIPFSILLLLHFFRLQSTKNIFKLFIYNLFIFFIHPYLAFGLCIFTFLSLVAFELFYFKKENLFRDVISVFTTALLPMLLFQTFLWLTDHHLHRPTLPFGLTTSVSTFGSLLVPTFGPFQNFLSHLFHTSAGEFEGYCYLGIAFITLAFIFMFLLPFAFKKIQLSKELSALLIASILLLAFSFGIHLKLLDIDNKFLNQFRALGRFSWFFYYVFPIFVFSGIYHFLKNSFSKKIVSAFFGALTFIYFLFNLVEAGTLFRLYEPFSWKDRNFFSETYLTTNEKRLINTLKSKQFQAILPLPTFNVGSEIYDRLIGEDLSYPQVPSFMYSYHTGLPIASARLSRNSIPETEQVIELLNVYKKNRPAIKLLNDNSFLIIKTKGPLMADEERILSQTKFFYRNDSLQFGALKKNALLLPIKDSKQIIATKDITTPDSNAIVFLKHPILTGGEYNFMYTLDSNKIKSGNYIVSLHYYYQNNSWKDLPDQFLLAENKIGKTQNWNVFVSIRTLSGFYKGYGVFEYKIKLDCESSYGFILQGNSRHCQVSDFLLRPEETSVKTLDKNVISWNNFPEY